MKRITIEWENPERHGFNVVDEDGRYTDTLSFDEMLGQVVGLTYNGPRTCPMRTKEEWAKDEALRRRKVDFDGPCPFLMCLIMDPHGHPVCLKHNTVNSTVDGGCGQCELDRVQADMLDKMNKKTDDVPF